MNVKRDIFAKKKAFHFQNKKETIYIQFTHHDAINLSLPPSLPLLSLSTSHSPS